MKIYRKKNVKEGGRPGAVRNTLNIKAEPPDFVLREVLME